MSRWGLRSLQIGPQMEHLRHAAPKAAECLSLLFLNTLFNCHLIRQDESETVMHRDKQRGEKTDRDRNTKAE